MLHHQPQPLAPSLFCVYAHLLIGIQPPSIWTETSLIHTCDQSGFDIGLIIYVCLHLPAINNVRLTLFSCIREDHSTVYEVLFTISTVSEQPDACLVELHGQCGIDPRELGPIPALKKKYNFYR